MNNLWWNTVPNSVRFINDIVAAFNEGSSVVCVISDDCEWVDTYRAIIQEKIRSGVDKTYDISGKLLGDRSPGEYLTENFVKSELRTQYRTSIGYEAFLTRIESDSSLVHSYIYLRDLNEKQTHEWLDFIYRYNKLHKQGEARAKFILESGINLVEELKGIKIFRRSDYLHTYDVSILCMLATSSFSFDDVFREYLTELATLCSNSDPELAAELVGTADEFITNTQAVVDRIIANSMRSNGKPFQEVHDLRHIIWKAQLKVFFPLIERYRLNLIEKYKDDIPIHRYITNLKGEEVESVYDVELNTLKWLCDNGEMYLQRNEYEEMSFMKKCRNTLAHLGVLSFKELTNIIKSARVL